MGTSKTIFINIDEGCVERLRDELISAHDSLKFFRKEKKKTERKLSRNVRHQEKLAKYRNAIAEMGLLIGFLLGLIVSVSTMLDWHGPTVTIHGTILAMVIYLIGGMLFAFMFGFLTEEMMDDIKNQLEESQRKLEAKLPRVRRDYRKWLQEYNRLGQTIEILEQWRETERAAAERRAQYDTPQVPVAYTPQPETAQANLYRNSATMR